MHNDDVIPDVIDDYIKEARRTHKGRHSAPLCLATREPRRCQALSARTGKPCQTSPLHGTSYCVWHTGNNARLLGALGGYRRRVYDPDRLKPLAPPKNAAELRDLLAQTIVETRTGKIEPRVANTLAYLSVAFLHALEITELEPRLRALETQLTPEGRSALPN